MKQNNNQPQPVQVQAQCHQTDSSPVQKMPMQAKTQKAYYAGRITIGIALIIIGVVITADLLMPRMDLIKLAKVAPLILVVFGLEILITAMRHKDGPVKVGFGMVVLCLFLVGGSIGFALLGEVLDNVNPQVLAQVKAQSKEKEQAVYAQIDPTSVRDFEIFANANYALADTTEWYASMKLTDAFENKEQFSAAAAEILHLLAQQDVTTANIYAESKKESYILSVEGVYAMAEVTGPQLEKLVQHSIRIMDENMSYKQVSEEKYTEMKQAGMLVDAEALKTAYEKGEDAGYQKALEEIANDTAAE